MSNDPGNSDVLPTERTCGVQKRAGVRGLGFLSVAKVDQPTKQPTNLLQHQPFCPDNPCLLRQALFCPCSKLQNVRGQSRGLKPTRRCDVNPGANAAMATFIKMHRTITSSGVGLAPKFSILSSRTKLSYLPNIVAQSIGRAFLLARSALVA